jgi:hypothetical protein
MRVTNGQAVYSGNFAQPTSPLAITQPASSNVNAIIANVTLLTNQSRRFIDNNINPLPINVKSAAVRNETPFANVTSYTGQSIYFDGTGDYIRNTTSDQFNIMQAGSANVTIEAWVYPQDLNRTLWTLGTEGPGRYTTLLTPNALYVNYYGAPSTFFDPIQANAWSHVAIVRQSNIVYAYINGIKQSNSETRTEALGNGFIRIGADGSGTSTFVGYMKDIRITKDVARYTANTVPPSKFTPGKSYQISVVKNPTPSISYMVVAGGGGSGATSANDGGTGGGGAGGIIYSNISVTAGVAYTIVVGAGGAGGTGGVAPSVNGINGANTLLTGLNIHVLSIGGGGGGGTNSPGTGNPGNPGGSGGGGGGMSIPPAGGTGVSGQGYAGGDGSGSGSYAGGGGGGAASVGSNSTSPLSGGFGNGGNGYQWLDATYYAGGGGGGTWFGRGTAGTGGLGGGGAGALGGTPGLGAVGTVNTGGGAGGGGTAPGVSFVNGVAGGSGVVVIRYANTYDDIYVTGSYTYTNSAGYKTFKITSSGTITF